MLDETVSELFYGKEIEVYFGGRPNETLKRKVVGRADGVIILEHNNRRDYINVERVAAFWQV